MLTSGREQSINQLTNVDTETLKTMAAERPVIVQIVNKTRGYADGIFYIVCILEEPKENSLE